MEQRFTQTQTTGLTQVQRQVMSPQQLLLVKLLEKSVTDLEDTVKSEIDSNEALEEDDGANSGSEDELSPSAEEMGQGDPEDQYTQQDYDKDERADYATDDDVPEYLKGGSVDPGELAVSPFGGQETLVEHLNSQIGEHEVTDKQRQILEYLIGSLDNDGLLRKQPYVIAEELSIHQNLETTEEEVLEALRILQTFDPAGIGATSLQQSLTIQLRRLGLATPDAQLAKKILQNGFDDFANNRKDQLARRFKVDRETLDRALRILTHLNPKPAGSIGDGSSGMTQIIVPDFYVTPTDNGQFDIRLNQGSLPAIHVSQAYRETLDQYSPGKRQLSSSQRKVYAYMKQKVDAAQMFINAIAQRRNTLMKTMKVIVDLQKPFFEEGDETLLRPMKLKDVAERTQLDTSTISRVSNSKYVSTPYGVYPLKFFFNHTFVSSDGDELSKKEVLHCLKEIIDQEDKSHPLADEAIARMLKDKGYPVARRTVTKYREQLHYPVARYRKQ